MSAVADDSGHLGGVIVGFIGGYALFENIGQITLKDKMYKNIAKVLLTCYFAFGLLYFYLFLEV